MRRTFSYALSSLLLAFGLTGFASGTAQAATSCGAYQKVSSSAYTGYASYCPMWRGWVPVFGKDSAGYVNPNNVVGYLQDGGSANWFVCHWTAGRSYTAYGYTSSDYASTVADNGRKGWASAVYFAGSQNYWNGLVECAEGYYGWP